MAKPKPTDLHKQCKFKKPGKIGTRIAVSWIPAKHAKVGKYLKLKDDDGVWEDGWKVVEVWGSMKSTDAIAQSEFFKTHRDGTDRYRDKDGEWVNRKEKADA